MKRDPTRFVQIGFLALLFLCVLMVGYWILADMLFTNTVEAAVEALSAGQATAAETLELIGAESEGRRNRYLWEGAFFVVVLLGGMAVLTRTLRHDAELRRRQQNFLAAVSHEFKSPLASMQLAAETLVLRAQEPDAKRLGERLLEDCERLLRMVDNLLDTTRIEEGRHEMTTEETDLRAAVEGVVESFAPRAAQHSIEIGCHLPDAVSLAIDRQALDTILRNLVDNALKACIAGDGHRIDVNLERGAGRIELRVTDDGLGFAPEESSLMFEKFHRLGDELRRKTPGTGLGLYLVKKLAELSGASIRAESQGAGTGAAIALSWPERGTT